VVAPGFLEEQQASMPGE